MLVLSRKQNQSIVINGDIRITVVSIRGNQVRIGVEAPERRVYRKELWDDMVAANKAAAGEGDDLTSLLAGEHPAGGAQDAEKAAPAEDAAPAAGEKVRPS